MLGLDPVIVPGVVGQYQSHIIISLSVWPLSLPSLGVVSLPATLPYHGSWHSTAQCCDPMPHVILSRQEHKQVPHGALLLANAALLLLSTF